MASEFLLMSPEFNFFFCPRTSKTLSVGGVGGQKCIYLPPTYLHSIQDIEDMCLLLLSSTSFVDLPF
jgi:hypothetical protein